MFTGIIESVAKISQISKNKGNLDIRFKSSLTNEFKVDQSISHNGICMTVVEINNDEYSVTAINETIQKSAIGKWKTGDLINIERAMKIGDRLDGHMVQGHVDQVAICSGVSEENGSWIFKFEYSNEDNLTVEKGSISVNGISLTVIDSKSNGFSVAIIPYTFHNTSFKNTKVGDVVNLEFDVIGKYLKKMMSKYN